MTVGNLMYTANYFLINTQRRYQQNEPNDVRWGK